MTETGLAGLLPQCGPVLHAARSVAQADVFPLEFEGQAALLKSFHLRPWLVRALWSGRICAREVRMLRRLEGLPHTPQLLATAGRCAFVMTRLPAVRLPLKKEPPPQPEFWDSARRLIAALHARKVAHGDVRRKNLLMNAAGTEAYLIDFATAQAAPENNAGGLPGMLRRNLFERCRRIDLITYARIKASYGVPLAPDEAEWLANEPWYLSLGRWYKQNIYQWRKPRYREKMRRKRAKARQA